MGERRSSAPDGLDRYLLRIPEFDSTNGLDPAWAQHDGLVDLESEARSLVAVALDIDPDDVELDVHGGTGGQTVEVCRDRVIRAAEIRQQIGKLWGEYIDRGPRWFAIEQAGTLDTWTLVLRTIEPMPTRLSTLFGEWLYCWPGLAASTVCPSAESHTARPRPRQAR